MKLRVFFLVSTVLAAVSAIAQTMPLRPQENRVTAMVPNRQTYGTADETVLTFPSSAFLPYREIVTWGWLNNLRWVSNNGGCCLEAPAALPAGSAIIGFELEGCDNSATTSVWLELITCGAIIDSCTVPENLFIDTGTSATPGCGLFRVNFATPLTVDNNANLYLMTMGHNGGIGGTNSAIWAARLFYKLQVSDAPLTATFTDVPPTHLFFQYIEALAASGITAGCSASPPQFCPDAALTRGQMAVFLSRALGLHWAP